MALAFVGALDHRRGHHHVTPQHPSADGLRDVVLHPPPGLCGFRDGVRSRDRVGRTVRRRQVLTVAVGGAAHRHRSDVDPRSVGSADRRVTPADAHRRDPSASTTTPTEIRLAGGNLHKMTGDAGQFVIVRPMVKGLWWQAHPFSLSAAPTTSGLTISVKNLGDGSASIRRLPRGTRMIVEGPFGACTPRALEDRKVLFIVGGVGVTPVKAMLERLDRRHQPIVLYRASRHDDLIYVNELREHGPGTRRRVDDPGRPHRDSRGEGSVLGQGVGAGRYPISPNASPCCVARNGCCGPDAPGCAKQASPQKTSTSSSRGGDPMTGQPPPSLGRRLLPALVLTTSAAGLVALLDRPSSGSAIDARLVTPRAVPTAAPVTTRTPTPSAATVTPGPAPTISAAAPASPSIVPPQVSSTTLPSGNTAGRGRRVHGTDSRRPDDRHPVGSCAGRSGRVVEPDRSATSTPSNRPMITVVRWRSISTRCRSSTPK